MEPLWWVILRGIIRCIWIILDQLLAVPVYFILLAMFSPLRWIWPLVYWELESYFFRELIRMIGYWLWSSGISIVEYGDLPFRYVEDRCIVLVNHQSSADVPTLCATVAKKGIGGGKISWVLDVMFKWTNFGAVNLMHGDFFIQQGRDVRQQQNIRLAQHLRDSYVSRDRRWFIIFPEGGFLFKRRESSQAYARAHGFPVLQHVTLPRIGAVQTMLVTMNPIQLDLIEPVAAENNRNQENILPCCIPRRRLHLGGFRYLVDITLGYPNGNPITLWSYIIGDRPGSEVGIHYRLLRCEDVPHNNEVELRDFLYDLWQEKERKLAHYNQFGHFPGIPRDEGCVVDYHLAGMISRQCLFIVIAYILYWYVIPVRFLLRTIHAI